MPIKVLSGSLTDVDTSRRYELGQEYERMHPDGDKGVQVWVYVYNDEAATDFGIGEVVERDAATATHDGVQGAATTTRASALGVAQHVIGFGKYGWILRRGIGQVLCDGSVTADADVVPAASGQVTDFTAGSEHRVIGLALATDAGASTLVAADISC